MRDGMTIEAVRKYYDAQPFMPFEIHLADGRVFPVPHREFLLLGPTGRTVVVAQAGQDAFDILDVRLVTGLHVHAGGAMNGGD
jgi:hypothetical protein